MISINKCVGIGFGATNLVIIIRLISTYISASLEHVVDVSAHSSYGSNFLLLAKPFLNLKYNNMKFENTIRTFTRVMETNLKIKLYTVNQVEDKSREAGQMFLLY